MTQFVITRCLELYYWYFPLFAVGLPYSMSIDMWSFGCILAELHTGRHLCGIRSTRMAWYPMASGISCLVLVGVECVFIVYMAKVSV